MPRKTDGEKIDEMEKVIATFAERLDNVRKELKETSTSLTDAAKTLGDLKTELALLRKDVEGFQTWKDELKKEKDEKSQRIWAFGPNVLGAVVNVLLSAFVGGGVAYLTTHYLQVKP